MKLLIDIGHPAHVHYFKNLIKKFGNNHHHIIVVAREKEISFELLRAYNINFISRGKGKNSLLGKLFYLLTGSYKIFKVAKRNRIDIFLSFGSPYNAIASVFLRKPNISMDDTEHDHFNHSIYAPLSKCILTPHSFRKNFGNKHIRFSGAMEFAYLHPDYFQKPVVNESDNIVIIRLVSWTASHDINQAGFKIEEITKLVDVLISFKVKILISSENPLPAELAYYSIRIRPEEIHYYMARACLFIGESGSMATEAAFLGTHSIVLNSAAKELGVFEWYSGFKIFHIASDFKDVIQLTEGLLREKNMLKDAELEANKILHQGINLTDFLMWFIESYPQSVKIMKEEPEFQYNFR